MANRGVAPPNFGTPVGRLRRDIGDTQYIALVPAETGFGDYAYFSDSELEQYITDGNSHSRTVGFLYLTMAGIIARNAELIRTYDLTSDTRQKPADFRALAQMWFGIADDEDSSESGEDSVIVFSTGSRGCLCHPEAAPYPARNCGAC